ncbi:MAG: YMGG-like glycine zipper-containing protein [Desulfovibrio sp.]
MKKLLFVLIAATFLITGCANKAQQGGAIGAGTGALLGALVAGDKVQGAAIGAGVGLLMGYVVGNEMDKADAQRVSHALDTTPSGVTSSWVNPDTGRSFDVTPEQPYQSQNKIYRDVYIKTTDANGQPREVKAQAYRDHNGQWVLKQ